MMFSMKMRALETAIFMPGGEQKLLMELFYKYEDRPGGKLGQFLLWK